MTPRIALGLYRSPDRVLRRSERTDPDISADGSVTTFFSVATNLVAGDTNTCPVFQVPGQCADIFVHVESTG